MVDQSEGKYSNEDEIIVDVEPSICRQCGAWAREGSAYCGHTCGIAAHMQRVIDEQKKKLLELKTARYDLRWKTIWSEIQESIRTGSFATVVEEEEASSLVKVEKDYALERTTILNYTAQREQLEREIQQYQVDWTGDVEDDAEERASGAKNSAHFDCPYCGIQPTTAILSNHLPSCYQKFEAANQLTGDAPTPAGDVTSLIYCDHHDPKTGKYCKKLKESCYAHSGVLPARPMPGQRGRGPEFCGAPTLEDPSGRCRAVRSRCTRHLNWENLTRRQYDLQIISHTQLAEALKLEIEIIKDRMVTARLSRGLKGSSQTIPSLNHTDLNIDGTQRKGKRKNESASLFSSSSMVTTAH